MQSPEYGDGGHDAGAYAGFDVSPSDDYHSLLDSSEHKTSSLPGNSVAISIVSPGVDNNGAQTEDSALIPGSKPSDDPSTGDAAALVDNRRFYLTPEAHYRQYALLMLLGFINNLGYVVVLSAAKSLAQGFDKENMIGALQWANVGFGLIAKFANTAFFLTYSFTGRMVVCTAFLAAGLILTALSTAISFEVAFFGILLIGTASAFGESVLVGYFRLLDPALVGAWSSGTGGAGVGGSAIYLVCHTALGLSDKVIFLLLLPLSAVYYAAFFIIHTRYAAGSGKPMLTFAESRALTADGAAAGADSDVGAVARATGSSSSGSRGRRGKGNKARGTPASPTGAGTVVSTGAGAGVGLFAVSGARPGGNANGADADAVGAGFESGSSRRGKGGKGRRSNGVGIAGGNGGSGYYDAPSALASAPMPVPTAATARGRLRGLLGDDDGAGGGLGYDSDEDDDDDSDYGSTGARAGGSSRKKAGAVGKGSKHGSGGAGGGAGGSGRRPGRLLAGDHDRSYSPALNAAPSSFKDPLMPYGTSPRHAHRAGPGALPAPDIRGAGAGTGAAVGGHGVHGGHGGSLLLAPSALFEPASGDETGSEMGAPLEHDFSTVHAAAYDPYAGMEAGFGRAGGGASAGAGTAGTMIAERGQSLAEATERATSLNGGVSSLGSEKEEGALGGFTMAQRLKRSFGVVASPALQLAAVYFFEYVVCVGFASVANPHPSNWAERKSYEILSFCYQTGVWISRSSIGILQVRRIEIITIVQALNFVFWFLHVEYGFMSVYVQFAAMLWVGLFAGGMYVNVFYWLLQDSKYELDRELGLNIVSFFINLGIMASSVFTLVADNTFLAKFHEKD